MAESRDGIPINKTEDDIYDIFINEVAGYDLIYINGTGLAITINYRITDPNQEAKEVIIPEKKGEYTQSPVLEINDVKAFKKALYEYVKTYTESKNYWTMPDIAKGWMQTSMYAMSVMWTNATNQDFTNPVDFILRYKAFLEQDQWQDLKTPKKIKDYGNVELYKSTSDCMEEREAPNHFFVFAKGVDGKKQFFPSIVYGIRDDKAYVLAIHQIYNKENNYSEDVKKLRNTVKGRGVEPLGLISLIAFMEEAKKRGIKQIVMPDNFVMQYTVKNRLRLWDDYNKLEDEQGEEEVEEKEVNEDEAKIDNFHAGSMDRRLRTMMNVIRYYSSGAKILEVPGEVSDNLTIDIQNFRLGKEEKPKMDRRRPKEREDRQIIDGDLTK